ncbi:hypothetical protein J7H87_002281 [Vibrio parahaemolyticus]|uniref:PIN-like domain-containing protein n=3 Tax=Vibrio parahaemolyticus TaxID=670 RepID=UPI00111F2815|nr:PIN-like domain-containing protein [Vibrio parahaemolyticus]EHH1109122.1 hypothetical protein [Vibrio parahaemolyticus]EHK0063252.1 hypothetical protein [Vibrio parahaemolyticus]TOH51008.1 hypothetical protein CGI80_10405 [Vibrio parahaemolyticus]HCE2133028.1 hypothetical protein [Vibrio parahaemolyticus]
MKSTFKNFYNLTDSEVSEVWNSEDTLVVFDTNVFLNLYGYTEQTRADFFKVLDGIKKNLWIPYHVGLEYQLQRLSVISAEKKVFSKIDANLGKLTNVFKSDFAELSLNNKFPKLHEKTIKLEKDIKKLISDYKRSAEHWNKEQACVRSHDAVRAKLNDYFDGRVGSRPHTQEYLNSIYEEGKERYENQIPPGFYDSVKEKRSRPEFYSDGLRYERKYGDLIIWKQIIDRAKDNDIKNVIFVTDDKKPDWWFEINSNGTKTIGPQAELQAEIYREAGINKFHMYDTSTFLSDGTRLLSIEIDSGSLDDIESFKKLAKEASLEYFVPKESYKDLFDVYMKDNFFWLRSIDDPSNIEEQHLRARLIKNINKANDIENLLNNDDIGLEELGKLKRELLIVNKRIKHYELALNNILSDDENDTENDA